MRRVLETIKMHLAGLLFDCYFHSIFNAQITLCKSFSAFFEEFLSIELDKCKPRLRPKVWKRLCSHVKECENDKFCGEGEKCVCDEDCGQVCKDIGKLISDCLS